MHPVDPRPQRSSSILATTWLCKFSTTTLSSTLTGPPALRWPRGTQLPSTPSAGPWDSAALNTLRWPRGTRLPSTPSAGPWDSAALNTLCWPRGTQLPSTTAPLVCTLPSSSCSNRNPNLRITGEKQVPCAQRGYVTGKPPSAHQKGRGTANSRVSFLCTALLEGADPFALMGGPGTHPGGETPGTAIGWCCLCKGTKPRPCPTLRTHADPVSLSGKHHPRRYTAKRWQ